MNYGSGLISLGCRQNLKGDVRILPPVCWTWGIEHHPDREEGSSLYYCLDLTQRRVQGVQSHSGASVGVCTLGTTWRAQMQCCHPRPQHQHRGMIAEGLFHWWTLTVLSQAERKLRSVFVGSCRLEQEPKILVITHAVLHCTYLCR